MILPFAFIGGMGYGEMLLVGFIALLLFGKKLPEVARSLGKGVTEFKKGVQGIEEEIRDTTTTPYNELPHSTEPQTPQAPKFEPPTSPPTDADTTSSGDPANPADEPPKTGDRPAD
jgi:sec-independent protein translocase protein TatA